MVTADVNSVTVIPTVADPTASVTVNGLQIFNGLGTSVPVNVGDNTIKVVVTAQDGTTKQTYMVIVHKSVPQEAIFATNLLTPNGDGKNDLWVIKDIQLYPNNRVRVFDKAGKTVYTKEGYTNDWDGTFQGKPLAEDTYYYVIELGPGLRNFTGFVTIVRSRR